MEKFFDCPDGCKLFYRIDDFTDPWKAAPTVLFVHGFAESGVAWRAWVPYFARHFRVIRVDLRGYGRSTPMPIDFNWTLNFPVDDLVALIRHLNCGAVHLVGAKSGGAMVFKLAADHPELVQTLTGVTPAVRSAAQSAPAWAAQISEQGMHAWARDTMQGRLGSTVTQAEFDWWVNNVQGKTPVSTVLGYLRMVPVMDVRGELEKIVCPTLVVMTAGAGRRSVASYKKWQTRIKNSELHVVEGDAWHAAGAYPDSCAQATAAFIKRHSPTVYISV